MSTKPFNVCFDHCVKIVLLSQERKHDVANVLAVVPSVRPGFAQEVHGGVPAGVRPQEGDGVWRGPLGAAPRPAALRALRGDLLHG